MNAMSSKALLLTNGGRGNGHRQVSLNPATNCGVFHLFPEKYLGCWELGGLMGWLAGSF